MVYKFDFLCTYIVVRQQVGPPSTLTHRKVHSLSWNKIINDNEVVGIKLQVTHFFYGRENAKILFHQWSCFNDLIDFAISLNKQERKSFLVLYIDVFGKLEMKYICFSQSSTETKRNPRILTYYWLSSNLDRKSGSLKEWRKDVSSYFDCIHIQTCGCWKS